MPSVKEFKSNAINQLKEYSPSPELDVQVLLQHALKCDKTQLLLFANNSIPDDKLKWLKDAVSKRKTGLPVAYITGIKEFFGFDFFVTPDVLIPKPDTEILVERALELIEEYYDCMNEQAPTLARPPRILDLCTGSGCIGLSVLKTLYTVQEIPAENLPELTLTDISEAALQIAKKNAAKLLPDQDIIKKITFIHSDLFQNIEGEFDFILTNPPYIPSAMVDELLKDGRNEPRLALDGDAASGVPEALEGQDGTFIIKKLIPQACGHLAQNGTILMETGEYNAQATALFAQDAGFKTSIHKDLEGQLRVVEMNSLQKN